MVFGIRNDAILPVSVPLTSIFSALFVPKAAVLIAKDKIYQTYCVFHISMYVNCTSRFCKILVNVKSFSNANILKSYFVRTPLNNKCYNYVDNFLNYL